MIHERRQQIIEWVQKSRVINNKDLMERFGISIETVRRDLKYLEQQGYLECVYGGAVAKNIQMENESISQDNSEDAKEAARKYFLEYDRKHTAEKDRIAREAVKLIEPGDTIFLDEGSTVLAMTRYMKEIAPLTVITNSLRVAIALDEAEGCTVIIPGGTLSKGSWSVVAFPMEDNLGRFNIDKAFVGVIGITETHYTDYPTGGGYVRYHLIRNSRQAVALADHSKFGVSASMNVSGIEQLDVLITDGKTPEKYLELMRQAGVQVIVAES